MSSNCCPPNTSSPKPRKVRVILLRHGERADEVPGSSQWRHNLSSKERLDPSLTAHGYHQARQAWKVLWGQYPGATVYVSPLRRTLGTAVAALHAVDDAAAEQPRQLRMLVANGLCDCAARVRASGGAYRATQKGYIDGAAMVGNRDTRGRTLLRETLCGVLRDCQRALGEQSRVAVQLFHRDEDTGECVPLTDQLDEQTAFGTTAESDTSAATTTTTAIDTTPLSSQSQSWFDKTLNQIVRQEVGDTCILVTHREGIKIAARELCGLDRRIRLPTPYCCIGSFVATVHPDGNVSWEFVGLHAAKG